MGPRTGTGFKCNHATGIVYYDDAWFELNRKEFKTQFIFNLLIFPKVWSSEPYMTTYTLFFLHFECFRLEQDGRGQKEEIPVPGPEGQV